MLIDRLIDRNLIHPPRWMRNNVHYLTLMGSVAYGCSDDTSDCDMYGFCIPEKDMVFRHLRGEIDGFGKQKKRFDCWQQHHVYDENEKKEYDFQIFSIVRYFHLCMENNPNCLDALFVPQNCIIHSTAIGNLMREHRREFLHKGCWPKLKGYSFNQLHKMNIKNPKPGSKRYEDVQKHGWDRKFGLHVVRLMLQAEQILTLGDLDLQRDKEILKAIRRGEWTEEDIRTFFSEKGKYMEKIYSESKLPWGPDEEKIKELLLNCLEMHYGNLDNCITIPGKYENALRKIADICHDVGIS